MNVGHSEHENVYRRFFVRSLVCDAFLGGKFSMMNMLPSVRGCYRWIGLGVFCVMLVGCGEDPRQLFETAQFEEQQHNRAHAQELYEQVIQQHPGSEFAEKARQRLEAWKTESPEEGK